MIMTVTSQAISKILLLGWCTNSVISQVGDKDEEVVEVVHTCARSPGKWILKLIQLSIIYSDRQICFGSYENKES